MSTVSVTPSKRKIIDLKDDTFKTLSIMAIQKGTNLKNYIEDILNGIAEDYEDAKLYAKLRKEQPEGLIRANKEEQEDFEKWLSVGKSNFLKPLSAIRNKFNKTTDVFILFHNTRTSALNANKPTR